MKRRNKLVYTLSIITYVIIYLVIYLYGKNALNIVFVDGIAKQPINNIKSIIKDDKPNEEDNKNNAVKPNTTSPIKYVYDEDKTRGNYIYMTNQFPTKDEVGRKLSGEYKTFDFKLEFKGASLGARYDITLEKMKESDLENDWVKVYLEKDKEALSESIRDNGRVKTFNNYISYNGKENEIVLYQGVVTANDIKKGYKDFTLRMWISEDVKVVNEEYKSKTIIARVNVYAFGK